MPIIYWAVTNMNGELEGERASLNTSTRATAFDEVVVPPGYMKVRLTLEKHDELAESYDPYEEIYDKGADPIDSTVRTLTEQQKADAKSRRPEWYREEKQSDGRIKHKKKDGSEFEKKEDGTLIYWK